MIVDASFRLLADDLGDLVIVEVAKRANDRRTPRHATGLCALLLVDMGDLARRNRVAGKPASQGVHRVARMGAEKPVGPAPSERIEFDSLNRLTGAQRPTAGCVEEIGLEQGDLGACEQHRRRKDHAARRERRRRTRPRGGPTFRDLGAGL